MFRALLTKEWRQLRGLRWAGLILGLLMPLVLISGAEAGQRGWLPFGKVSSYSVGTILVDAMWPLMVGLWGLLALLFSSQSFAGDRSAGTESFLIERPVPRSSIWRARWLASMGSTLVLIAMHAVYWFILVRAFGDATSTWAGAGWFVSWAVVALTVVVGSIAGLAAAAFVRAPIQAVLMGLVLGVIPLALSTFMGGMFGFAEIGNVPIGLVIPALLLVGYVFASYRMICLGEPAGRGRLRRGVVILVVSLLAVPVVFAVAAPITMRLGARYDFIQGPVGAARSDRAAIVLTEWPESGWLVDLEKKRLERFFPKPVHYAAWNSAGTRLAMIQSGHPFGRQLSRYRLELFDGGGRPVGRPVFFHPSGPYIVRPVWAGERLIVQSYQARSASLRVYSADLQSFKEIPIEHKPGAWRFIGPIADGSVFVYSLVSRDPNRFALNRVDLERGVIESPPIFEEQGVRMGSERALSPSGRYWLRNVGEPPVEAEVLDIETGEVHRGGFSMSTAWLSGDRWARVVRVADEKRLLVGVPGVEAETQRAWKGQFVQLTASPDQERLLVRTWGSPETGEKGSAWMYGGQLVHTDAPLTGLWVFDPADGSWKDLHQRLGTTPNYLKQRLRWAGTQTLTLSGEGLLALIDTEASDGIDYLIGGP